MYINLPNKWIVPLRFGSSPNSKLPSASFPSSHVSLSSSTPTTRNGGLLDRATQSVYCEFSKESKTTRPNTSTKQGRCDSSVRRSCVHRNDQSHGYITGLWAAVGLASCGSQNRDIYHTTRRSNWWTHWGHVKTLWIK